MSERYEAYFKELVLNEGGYSNDPLDSGGKTIYGITQKNYPDTFAEVYDLHIQGKKREALDKAKQFYWREFYDPLYDEIIDSSLAFRLFDFGINAGKWRAVRRLQDALFLYETDIWIICGINYEDYYEQSKSEFSEILLKITNAVTANNGYVKTPEMKGESILYVTYISELAKYYRSLSNFLKFGKGWLKRLNRVFNGCPDLYKPVPDAIKLADSIKPKPMEEIK